MAIIPTTMAGALSEILNIYPAPSGPEVPDNPIGEPAGLVATDPEDEKTATQRALTQSRARLLNTRKA